MAVTKEQWDAMVAEVARAQGFKASLIAFLAGQPSSQTVGETLASLKDANDVDAAALEAAGNSNPA